MWVFVVSMTSHFKDTIAEVREVLMDQRWAETEDKCYVRITKERALKILSLIDRLERLEADRCAMREALDHITCRKRIDRYNCTLETVQEFARDCLAKLEEK